MERQIEKLKEKVEKKSSRTNRVRTDIFGEGNLEDNYMDLQREWTRNNARPSKESRDRNRQVRRIKSVVLQPGGLLVSVLRSPLGGRATTIFLLSGKSDKSKKL